MKLETIWDNFLHIHEYFTTEIEALAVCLPGERVRVACTNGPGGMPLVWCAPTRYSTRSVSETELASINDDLLVARIRRERLDKNLSQQTKRAIYEQFTRLSH